MGLGRHNIHINFILKYSYQPHRIFLQNKTYRALQSFIAQNLHENKLEHYPQISISQI